MYQFLIRFQGINRRIAQATSAHPPLHHLPNGIYRFNSQNAKRQAFGIDTIKYAGDQLLTLASVLAYVMYQQVASDEFTLILQFLKFLKLVRSGGETNPNEVEETIFRFKSLWIEVFPPSEKGSDGTATYSYKFPNFDTVDAWPKLLQFLGPSFLYSAELWEIQHQTFRRLKHGNGKNPEADVLTRQVQQKELDWEEQSQSQSHQPKPEFQLIGNLEEKQLTMPEVSGLKSCYKKLHNIPTSNKLPRTIQWSEAIQLNGRTLRSGSFVLIKSKKDNKQWFAEFGGSFLHKILGREYQWLYIFMYTTSTLIEGANLIELPESSKIQDFVPVNNDFEVTRVQVISENARCSIYNGWV